MHCKTNYKQYNSDVLWNKALNRYPRPTHDLDIWRGSQSQRLSLPAYSGADISPGRKPNITDT